MKRHNWILFYILFLGFIIRVIGINFGLPGLYHADEPIVVNHAIAYGTGDLNPHFFAIPPLVSYILFFIYGLWFVLGFLTGIYPSPEVFAAGFLSDPTLYYLIARLVFGAIFGTLTVWAVYRFAKGIFSERVALAAAFFMAVAFLHVQNSHYVYVDIPMVFFVVLTCIAAQRIIKDPVWKSSVLAGICVGVAAAIKYNALLVLIVPLAAVFFKKENRPLLRAAVLLVSACAVFIAANPFVLLDAGAFLNGLLKQAGAEFPLGPFYHIRYSLMQGVGALLFIPGVFGMLYFIKKKGREVHLVYLSFPFIFYLSLAVFSQPHERYVLPLVPFILIYAAGWFDSLKKNRLAFLVMVLIVAVPTLAKSAYSDYLFTSDDTRTLARSWIERNIPAGSSVAIEHSFFCPRLRQSKEQIREKLEYPGKLDSVKKKRVEMELNLAGSRPDYRLFFLKDASVLGSGFVFEQPQLPFILSGLKDNAVDYVVLHIDSRANLNLAFYSDLFRNAELLREFTPYRSNSRMYATGPIVQTGGPFFGDDLFSRERNGYRIQVFKLK